MFSQTKRMSRITATTTVFVLVDETLIQIGNNNTNDNVWPNLITIGFYKLTPDSLQSLNP